MRAVDYRGCRTAPKYCVSFTGGMPPKAFKFNLQANSEMQRIYMDANVFIAYIESDMGKPYKLMYKNAENFFDRCPDRYVVILSDLALREIEKIVYYSKEQTLEFFEGFGIKTEVICTKEEDSRKTQELCRVGMHEADASHAAFAINSKCDVLLTFNKRHFEKVRNLIAVKEPNELTD